MLLRSPAGDGLAALLDERARVGDTLDPLAHREASALVLLPYRLVAAHLQRQAPAAFDLVDFGLPGHGRGF